MSIITVSRLSKFYSVNKKEPGVIGSLKSFVKREQEEIKAVSDISFRIEEGELVGFIGPNGAGKTTTLKCLSGLLYPTSGNVRVLGYIPYQRKTSFLKQISLVMGQKNQLWWDLPARETLLLNKEIYEIDDRRYKEVVSELISLLSVENLLSTPVKRLSLGERMKFELISSLLHTPKILYLDEPTIGLDVVMQKNLRDFIGEYNRKFRATIILTSHYMRDVEALCKRVIVINHGKIIFDGLLSGLIKKFAPHKRMTIVFGSKVDSRRLEKIGEVIYFEFPKLVLNVPNKDISNVTSRLFKDFNIVDINIENPEIEDVIKLVYLSK